MPFIKTLFKCFVFIALPFFMAAQSDSIWQQPPSVSWMGFMDAYYVFDFNQPKGQTRQSFFYNHNRHNEFNLNLGLIKCSVQHPKYRANLGLQVGTYANDNYAAEDNTLQHVFEANVGIALNSTQTLWLDMGVLPSHIGFESAISLDNYTLTRSLLAENSPYFLAGAKLGFQANKDWSMALLVVNGWQRIQRLEGNSLPSIGTQVYYTPLDKLSFNWSTLIGTDDPDATRRMRYFNNLYTTFQLTPNVNLIAGLDMGMQQTSKNSSSYQKWMSPVLITQWKWHANWATALRAEYYQDPNNVIVSHDPINGFSTSAFSINIDYKPSPWIACRLEGRLLHSKNKTFEKGNGLSQNNFFIGSSIAVKWAQP